MTKIIFISIIIVSLTSCAENIDDQNIDRVKHSEQNNISKTALLTKKTDSIGHSIDFSLRDSLINIIFGDTSAYSGFLYSADDDSPLKILLEETDYQSFTSKGDIDKFKGREFDYLNNNGILIVNNVGVNDNQWMGSIDSLITLKKSNHNTKKLIRLKAGFIIAALENYSMIISINHCTLRTKFERVVTYLKSRNDVLRLEVSRCGFT